MGKLDEIRTLISSVEVGDIWVLSEDGTVDIVDNPLTPLGKFILKLEHIVDRDEKTVKELLQIFAPTTQERRQE